MEFRLWDTLFNLLIAGFWYQAWRRPDLNDHFNPFLAAINRPTLVIIDFLNSAFAALSRRSVAGALIGVLFVFRALVSPREAGQWMLRFGFESGLPDELRFASHVVFSLLSFGIFLFQLWGISLIFVRSKEAIHSEHTVSALYFFSRPFTDLPLKVRPVALYCFGVFLGVCLNVASISQAPDPGALTLVLKCCVTSLAAWVDLLMLLINLMVILIIGSWITMIAGSPEMTYFCRSWMDLILGPFRRFPLTLGPLDLTPIVYMVAVSVAWYFLKVVLLNSYLVIVN